MWTPVIIVRKKKEKKNEGKRKERKRERGRETEDRKPWYLGKYTMRGKLLSLR